MKPFKQVFFVRFFLLQVSRVPWAVSRLQNVFPKEMCLRKTCAIRGMSPLEEQDDLSEIKPDFGFFFCLLPL